MKNYVVNLRSRYVLISTFFILIVVIGLDGNGFLQLPFVP